MAGQKDDGPGGLAAAVQHTAMYKGRRSIPDRSSIFYSTASYRSYHSAASIPWTNFFTIRRYGFLSCVSVGLSTLLEVSTSSLMDLF